MGIQVVQNNENMLDTVSNLVNLVTSNYLFETIQKNTPNEMEKDLKDVLAIIFKGYNVNVTVDISTIMIRCNVAIDLNGNEVINHKFDVEFW